MNKRTNHYYGYLTIKSTSKKILCAIPFFLLLFLASSIAQSPFSIKGVVLDIASGEPLIGASIYEAESGKGAISDNFGHFELKDLAEQAKIEVSFIGYNTFNQALDLKKETANFIKINLIEGVELATLEVVANSEDQKFGRNIGNVNIDVKRLKAIPNLLGEQDVVKALTFAPGISSGYEGSVGLYVRGGTPDQNLILLDDAKIYNGSHLLGFLSSFNGDAIKQLTLHKGDKPAQYGGRLSSVLDIRVKEGNKKQKNIDLTISPISSKLLVELPIVENKTSLLIAGRASYLDLLTLPLYIQYKNGKRDNYFGYTMYDINAKLHHKFSDKTHLSLSYFKSRDRFTLLDVSEIADSLTAQNRIAFGNEAANLKFVKYFDKVSTNTSLVFSNFKTAINNQGNPEDSFVANSNTRSNISSVGIKSNWNWNLSTNHQLLFGGEWEREFFEPTLIDLITPDGTPIKTEDLWNETKESQSFAIYINQISQINDWIELNLGARFWRYQAGNYTRFFVEPRATLALYLKSYGSIKFAYNQSNQGVHLLTNNGLTLPTDFWLPATANLPTSSGTEWSVGWKKSFRKNLHIELGGFYKTNQDVITLKDGVNYYEVGIDIKDKLETNGQGRAYGVELLLEKKIKRFTGLLSYTWSKSERQFDAINNGSWYPLRYDRRHDLSITGTLNLNKNWSLAANFVYSSGFAITLPSAIYLPQLETLNPVLHFENRNNARNPAYLRADISATKKFRKSTLTFGVYNISGRRNPLYQSLFFERLSLTDIFDTSYTIQSEQTSFPAFIPSIAYTWDIK